MTIELSSSKDFQNFGTSQPKENLEVLMLAALFFAASLNFEALPYIKTLTIKPSTQGQAYCSPSIIKLYRFHYQPQEANFCNTKSLQLARPNPWADYSSPTLSSSSISTPMPTPLSMPTPTPTPTPGASGHPELGSAAEVVILGTFRLITILSITWF
ncbi:hypothetical protein BDW59DRAFT_168085 [Aspergillus cavernicola]|uniref:Uncharacterized protein n=1 Tax=Aspergillus cavernicola TaxID=176166 RepID=A0ABR4H644_9EURO